MTDDVFQRYSRYYDLLYRDKEYDLEAQYVARTLKEASPGIRSLLEFGSGSGKHGRLLAGHGFDVFGIERSDTMIDVARQSAPPSSGRFDCQQGDIQTTTLGRTFDAVISLFHVISYQTTNPALLQTFANAARHLTPGGYFFFDVWHGPAVLTERPAVRVKRVADGTTGLTRIAEPEMDLNAGVVTVRYTMLAESASEPERFVSFGEEHHMRYLFPTEVDLLARQSGFEVARSEEFLTGNAPTDRTWGVAYLLRRVR